MLDVVTKRWSVGTSSIHGQGPNPHGQGPTACTAITATHYA